MFQSKEATYVALASVKFPIREWRTPFFALANAIYNDRISLNQSSDVNYKK